MQGNIIPFLLSAYDLSLRKMGMDLALSQMDLGVEGREPYLGKLLGGSVPCDGLPTPVCVRSFSRDWRPVGPDLSHSSLRPSPQAGWFVRLVNPFLSSEPVQR